MKVTGARPKITVSADGRGVVGHAGARLLADVADATGLTGAFGEALAGLRQRRVSVSIARVSSLTWIVNVYVPSVFGVPKINPVLDAKSNSFVPSGSRPSTILNDGSFCELEHPATEMNLEAAPRPRAAARRRAHVRSVSALLRAYRQRCAETASVLGFELPSAARIFSLSPDGIPGTGLKDQAETPMRGSPTPL